MEALIAYSLTLFWAFYLLNYADITALYAKSLKEELGPIWGYPLSCAFCWGFWATLFLALIGVAPWWYLFTAPVVHLFIDLGYSRLSESHTSQSYQMSFDGSGYEAWCASMLEKPLP